jgi:DNA polymerase-3 subunit epsilon
MKNFPIGEAVFACIDCETTGLDPVNDRIIEVAVAVFDSTTIFEQYEALIDPKRDIPETSIVFHGITLDMVAGKPHIEDVLPTLIKMVDDHVIIGHGISFDIDVIVRAAERARIPCNLRNNITIDTLRMARLYGESPANSLGQLRKHFNLEFEEAHRAMNDVLVNIGVFRQLIKRYRTTRDILEALSHPIKMKNMPLGKHKGRPMSDLPLQYLEWAVRQDFDQDLIFSLRSEIKRRRQGNHFSQSANPFLDL